MMSKRCRESVGTWDVYLRQEGYVFIGVSELVSLFLSRITQKLINQFSQNLVER